MLTPSTFSTRARATFFLMALMLFFSIAPASQAAPNSPSNAAWNVNMSTNGANPAGYYGERLGHTYFPSPDDWRKVSVYQFITDRFRDGDPANNEGKYGGYNLYRVDMRHGGDFKGVGDQLDYIKSLGYNAIWISPVFQNRSNSYHSYAQIDFTLLDDRFGTLQDFRNMVDLAHSKGIYVIVDIVVNHMDNLLYFEGYPAAQAPFRMHSGEYKQFYRNPSEQYVDFWLNNTFNPNGQYTDVYNWNGTKIIDSGMGSGSFWESDFHHNGDLADYGNPWQNHLGKIYGAMDDLRTSHPRVQDKIIAMTKSLISSTDIDGIRMDTPMQVPLSFFKRWVPAVKAHAASLGKNNFFIFGEYYCDRARGATMTGRGKEPHQWGNPTAFIDNTPTMDGGINYAAYFSFFQSAMKDQAPGKLSQLKVQYDEDWRAYDFWDSNAKENRYEMLNFYNNHDQWRMIWTNDGQAKTNLGSAIIAFWPGIPLFYYGDEQGFDSEGTALDGWAREDFMTSLAWYNVKTKSGTPNKAIKDNFNMTSPEFLWVQKVMNVRRQYPALQTADGIAERWQQYGANPGIYAYTRIFGTQKEWVFVAFNTASTTQSAGGSLGTLSTGWNAGDTIVNVLNPSEQYTLGTNGMLPSLSVEAYGIKVFVRADNLKALDPVVSSVTPAHDARVTANDLNVQVTFSEPMDEQSVKEAFRLNGSAVPAELLSYHALTRTLSLPIAGLSDGLHKVSILESAKSLAGKNLYGAFTTRFRKGNDLNPIANPQLEWIRQNNLINNGAASTGSATVTLHHNAEGASKFRVSNDLGASWSEWQNYTPQSQWTLNGSGTKQVTVQYWTDGSAAYFADDIITASLTNSNVTWTGNVSHFPSNGSITDTSDLWLNIETLDTGAVHSVTAFYSVNNGQSWTSAAMNMAGQRNARDWWNLNLGKFAKGTTIQYYFGILGKNGSTTYNSNNNVNYFAQVNGPVINNQVTVYYKAPWNTNAANIHYRAAGGSWTTVPGRAMAAAPAYPGYWMITLDIGQATGISEAAFNNNAGTWDNNGGKNYTFPIGISTLSAGAVKGGVPVIIIDDSAPTAPENLSASQVTSSSATLNWTASTDNIGVIGYEIVQNGTKIASVTGTSYQAGNLSADTTHTFTVKAYDAAGNLSAASAELAVRTLTAPPSNTVTIYYKPNWNINAAFIHFRPAGGTWTTVPGRAMTAAAAFPGYWMITLDIGQATSIAEAAFNNNAGTWDNNGGKNYTFPAGISSLSGGSISSGTPVTTIDNTAPSIPANVTSSAQTTSSISLAWSASTDNVGVTGYELYRNGTKINTVNGTSYTDSGLSAATTYTYTLKALDAAGNLSAFSTAVNIRTKTTAIPNTVTIYYKKTWAANASFIHFKPVGGNWTTAPGRAMTSSAYAGYYQITIDLGSASGIAQAAFNNGSGTWDNNGGKDYSFGTGTFTLAERVIKQGTP